MSLPSGRQTVLHHGDQTAVVVEVGGGLRTYRAGEDEILDGYPPTEMCGSGRGQPLVPWPNRLAGGTYRFDSATVQAAIDEPEAGNAIHGLGRWRSWEVTDAAEDRAVLALRLRPSPGYPFELAVAITYTVDDEGLTVATQATNEGDAPCPYALGFHPYLAAGGGLVDDLVLRAPGRARYLTDEHGIPRGQDPVEGTEWDFTAGRRIGAVRLDTGYTELGRDTDGRARVTVTGRPDGRDLTLWMDEAFTHLMVFTGDTVGDRARRRRGLAVEPMTAAPDAFNSGDGLVVLGPGQAATATWGITPG